ncbi:hypothetical protein VA7868_03825 [Vibrio aerogenes CECT 7868]|uniref:Uncharacterized protein n=1 Tax=Vibrio aerogenes CECT 7868 TaxID=1216006 RepID=A0A1M6BLN9_9VIBR|nr:hypothetical protein VA7868_03825 [Vibrio aerogenes CECT 7868]
MITGKYDRQPDRSNSSKNVRDLALGSALYQPTRNTFPIT